MRQQTSYMMADEGIGGIDLELGIKKQLPEVVKEIFTEQQITEYKQLFHLYDYNNEGLINISLVPKILASAEHEYEQLDLEMAMQEIDVSKGPEIDEMIFLQLAAKCYTQSLLKQQIVKAFQMINQPRTGNAINKTILQYYLCDSGEPFDNYELKMFLFLAEPDPKNGDINYETLIEKLGSIVPNELSRSRIKKEAIMKAPKVRELVKRYSVKRPRTDADHLVKKSKSLDMLLKSIEMISEKGGTLGTSETIDSPSIDEEDYLEMESEFFDEEQPENQDEN
ncbi:hypothetical protein O3M35_011785 [Rhynocoris fuscipes]|uniref:Uncharacterized protein n=1 Tax=Rhynocoris fuscipes TaxID=488301 RepID=A0AAW1D2S6_9HEMI